MGQLSLSRNYHDTIAIIAPCACYSKYHHYHTPLGVIMMIVRYVIAFSLQTPAFTTSTFTKTLSANAGVYTCVYTPCLHLYTHKIINKGEQL